MEMLSWLAFEDKREYGDARGERDVFDLVNDPSANGVCRILGLGVFEEGLDIMG